MADFAGFELLKPFPILQMAAGAVVIIFAIFMTVRATKDNKRDGHIAPQGHDPLGMTIHANSIVGMLGTLCELTRQMLGAIRDIHDEQIKTNARLSEMTDRHGREMDSLRDTVDRVSQGHGQRRRS